MFFTALQFYTRLPIPGSMPFHAENLSPASRFLPLIGWITGGIAALVWALTLRLTDSNVAIICSMLVSILVTGALHEDGWADVCDGFGGGWTKEKILLIMKDSRIGAYGVIGLIGMLALKFSLLRNLATFSELRFFGLYLINAHALSRFMPVSIMFNYSYARDTDDSKASAAAQQVSVQTLCIAAILAILPLILLTYILKNATIMFAFPLLSLVTFIMGVYFKKWIGGYTGDCLGAVQQVCEVVFYLFIVVLWKFI